VQKSSKGQRRREKLAQQDAEREAVIAEEVASMGETLREAEEKQLQSVLEPLGLRIVVIPVRTRAAVSSS
jgi:OTU domain-containing protein 6